MAEPLRRSAPTEEGIEIPPYPAAAPFTLAAGPFALVGERRRAFRYLLLLRFVLLNLVAAALLGAAVAQGWVGAVLAADPTRLCIVIAAAFAAGLGLCAWRIVQTSREINDAKEFSPFAPWPSRALDYITAVRGRDGNGRMMLAQNLRMRLYNRIAPVRAIAGSLVMLGLIGTVVGFIIALSGVRPEIAADAGAVGPMVSTLIQGMSVALYTTLVGAVLNLWLMANFRLLASGATILSSTLIELGERHAGP